MIKYLGDFNKGATVRVPFNTNGADGASITIGTNGTARAWVDGSTTEITSGVTLTEDFDSFTGMHFIAVDTTGSGFTIGSDVLVGITANTIDGKTVNAIVGAFSINRRTPMQPYAGVVATYTNTTTITLPSECPATADALIGMLFVPVYGTGKDQSARMISAYTSGRVATLDPALTTAVDNATNFVLIRTAPAPASALPAVDAKKMNGVTILGAGTSGNKWRG